MPAPAQTDDGVRLAFERVWQRSKLGQLAASVRDGVREQPVGEPRVTWQQRTVEIRADRATDAAPLEAGLAIVSEPVENAAERGRARVEHRSSAVVLEARDRPPLAVELALEEHVADHPPLAADGVERKDAGARQLDTRAVAVRATEELISATDGKHRGATLDRRCDGRASGREVVGDQGLISILPAPDVEEIDVGGRRVSDTDRADVEIDPSSARPAREHRDVPAVGVDIQKVGIEMPDENLHATRSQYGRA